MLNLLFSFSNATTVFTEDEKREYADLIVEIFELKARGIL